VSGEVAFACEISEDRRKAAIIASGREKDGPRLVVDLVWYDHPREAAARLDELYAKHDPVAIVIDPRSQAATLLHPLAEAGVPVAEPSTADVVVAHGEFLDLVNDGALVHLEQAPLTAAVRAGQQRALAGAQAWERRLPVDQSPLVAATLACWAFRRWEELSKPGVWAI
jgi:hypothetical protein